MLVAFVKCEHTVFSLVIPPVCPPKSEKYTHVSQAVLTTIFSYTALQYDFQILCQIQFVSIIKRYLYL